MDKLDIKERQNYINEQLDLAKDKFECLKKEMLNLPKNVKMYLIYDFLGILEFNKVNKKSITCFDSLDNKVYFNEKLLDRYYIPKDTIRLWEVN